MFREVFDKEEYNNGSLSKKICNSVVKIQNLKCQKESKSHCRRRSITT